MKRALATTAAAAALGMGAWATVGVDETATMRALACQETVGPPAVCHPIDIGEARTIAECTSERDAAPIKDVIAALNTSNSPLVHMETLRRATIGMGSNGAKCSDLLSRLTFRAMDAESANKKEAAGLAYFDAAFLVCCFDQMGFDLVKQVGRTDEVNGYLWMQHALTLSDGNGEMEFATALLVHPAMHPGKDQLYLKHLDGAKRRAAKGSLLEKNVQSHVEMWSKYLDVLKK